jgi:hypothetical protein
MPKMISKMAHTYDGRELAAGEPFEAHEEYVHALELLGRAELAPAQDGQQYGTRQMVAADPAPAAVAVRQKRRYNTKHKTA